MKSQTVLDLLAAIRDGDFDANVELSDSLTEAVKNRVKTSPLFRKTDDEQGLIYVYDEILFIRTPGDFQEYAFVFPDGGETWKYVEEFIEERDRWMVVFQGQPECFLTRDHEPVADPSDEIVVWGPFARDYADSLCKELAEAEPGSLAHVSGKGRWGVVPVTVR